MNGTDLLEAGVSSLEDWFRVAPPEKGEFHWKDGRSAKEVARAWLRTGAVDLPDEVRVTLNLHADTSGFAAAEVYGERETRLDAHGGRHRVHDVLAIGDAAGGRTILAVEAKADESFGDQTLSERLMAKRDDSRSNVPNRVRGLVESIFGREALVDEWIVAKRYATIRYQLVHALAGTLIEATVASAPQAVLLIHEFNHDPDAESDRRGTSAELIERNAAALGEFVSSLSETPLSVVSEPPFLVGPFESKESASIRSGIQYFVGRITTTL